MNTPRATPPHDSAAPSLPYSSIVAIGDDPLAEVLVERLTAAGATVRHLPVDSKADALAGAELLIEASRGASTQRAATLHRLEHDLPRSVPIVAIAGTGPVAPLAEALHDASRLVGLSLCAGSASLRLAEVVARAAPPALVEALRSLLAQAGIRSIEVADVAEFHASRIARSYANEGLALLGEGVPAMQIESAAIEAGMRAGPLAVMDAISLAEADRLLHGAQGGHGHEHGHDHGHDHGHSHGHGHEHAHEHEHEHEHEHSHGHHADNHGQACRHGHHDHDDAESAAPLHGMTEDAVYVLEKMAHGFNRMGRESGRGFYDYEDGEEPELWSGLKVFERRRVTIPPEDIRDRLLFRLALESMRCLDEGVVASAADANLSSILGAGFPQATGGAIAFAGQMGPAAFEARARELAERYGERFAPTARLAGPSDAESARRA